MSSADVLFGLIEHVFSIQPTWEGERSRCNSLQLEDYFIFPRIDGCADIEISNVVHRRLHGANRPTLHL